MLRHGVPQQLVQLRIGPQPTHRVQHLLDRRRRSLLLQLLLHRQQCLLRRHRERGRYLGVGPSGNLAAAEAGLAPRPRRGQPRRRRGRGQRGGTREQRRQRTHTPHCTEAVEALVAWPRHRPRDRRQRRQHPRPPHLKMSLRQLSFFLWLGLWESRRSLRATGQTAGGAKVERQLRAADQAPDHARQEQVGGAEVGADVDGMQHLRSLLHPRNEQFHLLLLLADEHGEGRPVARVLVHDGSSARHGLAPVGHQDVGCGRLGLLGGFRGRRGRAPAGAFGRRQALLEPALQPRGPFQADQ
mmetsp:Transcript_88056/g.284318  ORF Transcript_88056/g.284318 Transcript_88056/m.284318 type:complete len:299 (-) Transcript_88056:232-1128(-)